MRVTPTLVLTFCAKTQKIDSHFSFKDILTSKLILTFHFKINKSRKKKCSYAVSSGSSSCAFWPAKSALVLHGVLAQLRQVALELRHVVAPRVLAHLVWKERPRPPPGRTLPAAAPRPSPPGISRISFQRLQSRSRFPTFKATLTLTHILTFCFQSQIFDSHFSFNENANFCHSHFVLTLIIL